MVFVHGQQGELLGEYDQNEAAIREYVWLGSTPIAMFTPDPANAANPPLVYYIHADHLDTPRVVVDRSDNLRWRWMAEPFGTTAPENNPSGLGNFTQNLRFPGQYADQESGLNYNYFRDYDSSMGRYTTFDPIGLAGGINGYAYVGGNPVSDVDPTGEAPSRGDDSLYPPTENCTCVRNCEAGPTPPFTVVGAMCGRAAGYFATERSWRFALGGSAAMACVRIERSLACRSACSDFCSGKVCENPYPDK